MSESVAPSYAEHAVLGAVFAEPHLVAELPLEVAHFPSFAGQATWRVLQELHKHGARGADVVVAQGIAERLQLSWPAVEQCLLSRLHLLPEATSVYYLAAQIREAFERKKYVAAVAELLDYHEERKTDFALMRDEIRALCEQTIAGLIHAEQAGDVAARVLQEIKQAKGIERIATGIPPLDREITGWRVGVVNVIAARPGQGKSTMTVNTAVLCNTRGVGIHVFSLEDSADFFMHRMIGRTGGVSIPRIQNGMVQAGSEDEWRVAKACEILRQTRMVVTDGKRGSLTVHDVVSTFRAMRAHTQARVCVVDYLGMLRYRGHTKERHLQVAEQVQALADFAARDKVAVVLVAQLNRGGNERRDPRPVLSDLKESSAIEEKAKLVVGLYRGSESGGTPIEGVDYAKGELPPSGDRWARMAQLLVLKNTAGRRATIQCEFDGEKGTIQ